MIAKPPVLQSTQRRFFVGSAIGFLIQNCFAQPTPVSASQLRELSLVVPVEPGGGIDSVARMVAQHWSAAHQVSASVFNRPGASGNVGTAEVGRSRADGRTLLVTGVSHLTSPMLHAKPGYHPLDDFAAVARLATAPSVIVVSDALKGMTLADVLQDPRSRDQGFAFASAGYGHTSHLAAEMFMARTSARWLHVPYKGSAPALRAVMADDVQIMFVPAASVAAALSTRRLRVLAVADYARVKLLPDTPTLLELGIAQAEFSQWYGLLAPRGTPPDTIRTLAGWSSQALEIPPVVAQLRGHGIEPDFLDSEHFTLFLASEHRRLGSLLSKERIGRPMN